MEVTLPVKSLWMCEGIQKSLNLLWVLDMSIWIVKVMLMIILLLFVRKKGSEEGKVSVPKTPSSLSSQVTLPPFSIQLGSTTTSSCFQNHSRIPTGTHTLDHQYLPLPSILRA